MKTKQDLLCKMTVLGACKGAMEYVSNQPDSASAKEIWLNCDRTDWLCWFAFRFVPVGDFAFGCANRAAGRHTYTTLSDGSVGVLAASRASIAAAEAAAADTAASRAVYAGRAADAAYEAADAADAAYAERKIQLDQLHAMWPQIVAACGGTNG